MDAEVHMPVYAFLLAVAFVAAYALLVVRHYRRVRGLRVVHCPSARRTATIELSARRAALLLAPLSETVVRRCSLWPRRQHCGQWCADELEYSSTECRLERILASWYQGKRCGDCGQTIPPVRPGQMTPSLRSPDGRLVEWPQVDPEHVFEILATHRPVCVSCDVSDVLRQRVSDAGIAAPADRPVPPAP